MNDAVELARISNLLVYSAMAVYALAFVAYAAYVAALTRREEAAEVRTPALVGVGAPVAAEPTADPDPQPSAADASRAARFARVGTSLTLLAFALHAAGTVARGMSADRVPWGNMYEFSLTGSLAATGVYLLVQSRSSSSYLGVIVVPAVLLSLGVAVTLLYTESGELVPALNSYWLVIHVAAAIISFGLFTVGAAATGLYLLRQSKYGAGRLAWLPVAAKLDRLGYQMHVAAFPIYTFAVLAGAVWAENAWGRYWGWDPKETWAFIAWVVYAAYLHARATAGWRGSRAAWIALLGYACFTFNYFGVNLLITGLHSYAR